MYLIWIYIQMHSPHSTGDVSWFVVIGLALALGVSWYLIEKGR